MKKLNIFYRLSDKGNVNERFIKINNRNCLENFLREFSAEEIEIVADNVEDETMTWLSTYNFKKIHQTSLGNSGSCWFAYKLALNLQVDEYVYFVENDYVHRPNSRVVLLEGLSISDYVTLYDHRDKYIKDMNFLVRDASEKTRVYLTASTHWKKTNSTTMTFASRVSFLRKDQFFFKLFTIGVIKKGFPWLKIFQEGKAPHDFPLFLGLVMIKRRKLISPVPGYSTHGHKDYLSPLINWEKYLG